MEQSQKSFYVNGFLALLTFTCKVLILYIKKYILYKLFRTHCLFCHNVVTKYEDLKNIKAINEILLCFYYHWIMFPWQSNHGQIKSL